MISALINQAKYWSQTIETIDPYLFFPLSFSANEISIRRSHSIQYFFPEILGNEEKEKSHWIGMKIVWKYFFLFPSNSSHQNPSKNLKHLRPIHSFYQIFHLFEHNSDQTRRSLRRSTISKSILRVCARWLNHHGEEEGVASNLLTALVHAGNLRDTPVLKVAPCESCEAKES